MARAQARSVKVLVHPEKDSLEAIATLLRSSRSVRTRKRPVQAGEAGLSVLGPSMRSMTRYVDEDLHGAQFRECDLTGARLIGVVMQDAVIDGLITNLVVNGVEVTEYVEAELDRRHPVRVLIRSEDPADLREASRQLHAGWVASIGRGNDVSSRPAGSPRWGGGAVRPASSAGA